MHFGRRPALSPQRHTTARISCLIGLLLSLVTSPALAQCPNSPIFSYNTNGSNGWTVGGGATTVTSPDTPGALKWVLNPGTDPQLKSPIISCAAASFNFFRIGTNNHGLNTSGRLYYDNGSGFSEARSVGFTNPSHPSRDSWITVRVGGAPGWTGTIRQIRVDPVSSGSGDPDNVDMNYVFWRNDTQAPAFRTTAAHPDPIEVTPSGWTAGDITVAIRGKDAPEVAPNGPDVYGSGCIGFNVSLDGAPAIFSPNTTFDDFNGDALLLLSYPAGALPTGAHTLTAQPVDLIGHVGPTLNRTLYVDTSPPSTPAISSVTPPGFSTINSFIIAWTSPGDLGSGVNRYQYLIDGVDGPYDVQGTTVTLAAPSVGTHDVQIRAVDNVGLVSEYSTAATVSFDDVPPDAPTGLSVSPSGFTNINSFTVTWNVVTDEGSGTQSYEWKIDDGPLSSTNTQSVSGALAPTSGSHVFSIRTRDQVNLLSPTWASTTFTWDPNYIPAPEVSAPVDGAVLGLPETFSWIGRAGATGYELQIAPGGNFNGPTWTSQTSLTSLTVPRDAAPQTGNYGWRLRSLGPSAPIAWGPIRGFTRVAAVGPPGSPALVYPQDGSTQGMGDVTFQWGAAPNATSYRLEVSTDPAFPTTAAGGVTLNELTSTLHTLTFNAPASTLFWRVTAKNSSGFGVPSATSSFALAAMQAHIDGALIATPSMDLSVEQGASIQASGLIVGRYQGLVSVEWLLDDIVFATSTLPLDGTGVDLDAVSVPTAVVGVHQLVLRVTTDVIVTSPPRLITITSPGVGPPDHLVVIADQPQILANTATPLYCTVRDAEGALVLSDNGRTVTFDPDSDMGTIVPLTTTTTAGLALATYTAAAEDADLTVTAAEVAASLGSRYSAAAVLKSDKVAVGSSATSLALEKKIALAYLDRLSRLPMDGIPGSAPSALFGPPWPALSVGKAWNFVTTARPGDEARLHRLNIFLRYLDRAYFYDPGVNKIGPAEARPIPGIGTMIFDVSNAISKLSIAVFKVVVKAPPNEQGGWRKAKLFRPVMDMLNKQLIVTFNKLGETIITYGCRTPVLKNDMLGLWSQAQSVSEQVVSQHPSAGIVALCEIGIGTRVLAEYAVTKQYVTPMQAQLNFVVDRLRQPTWNGGSHAPSEQIVTSALLQIRVKTDYQHRWFDAADKALDGNVVNALESAAGIVAGFGSGYMQAFQKILFLVVKNAILVSSGVDCWITASAIGQQQASVVAGYIVGNGGAPPSLTALTSETSLNGEQWAGAGQAPLSAASLAAASSDMASALAGYELIVHDLEQHLIASDTLGVQLVMTQLADAERDLRDAERSSGGPLFATFEDVRLTDEGHASRFDSLAALFDAASLSRSRSVASLTDWLAETDPALRDVALAQTRGALDTTRATFSVAGAALTLALGRGAVPYVSLASPRTPSLAFYADSVDVQVTAMNLGGGTTSGVRLRFVESADVQLVSPPLVEIGSLEPGQSSVAHWRARFYPNVVDSTVPVSVSFNIVVDSTGAGIGSAQTGSILVYPPHALAGVQEGMHVAALWLSANPNPSRDRVSFSLGAAEAGAGSLEIIDVTGRRIAVVASWPEGHAPTHGVWSGSMGSGRRAGPGIYFARLKTSRGTRVTRVVRIQ